MVAMEEPKTMHADAIRNEKVKALKAIAREPAKTLAKNVVLGQYAAGSIDGRPVPNYSAEKDVAKNSATETFVAAKLAIKNKRWKNVPFYLRTGKALQHKYAEIVITFKSAPCRLFCGANGKLESNKLAIRIQPDEGVKMQFNLKEQDKEYSALPYTMDFSHAAEFGMNTTEAYERLLSDVARGDQTLFTRWDEVQEAWKIVDNARKAKLKVLPYRAGSHGPDAALDLLKRDGRDWYGNKAVRKLVE
jgi:glucose-6-phosphate 1-dehydrogenase